MQFSEALKRQRSLPFGDKLQNHALNHRCNEEFSRYFPQLEYNKPIIRDKTSKRYWINEKFLIIKCQSQYINLASLIITLIDRYIFLKKRQLIVFFEHLEILLHGSKSEQIDFIIEQMKVSVDARIFEIVSFAIFKYHYRNLSVFYGSNMNSINEYILELYKTGKTNANDGGIDYILKPIGRIFQVTEVMTFDKYFLDIHKVNYYPITFVVKRYLAPKDIKDQLIHDARKNIKIQF